MEESSLSNFRQEVPDKKEQVFTQSASQDTAESSAKLVQLVSTTQTSHMEAASNVRTNHPTPIIPKEEMIPHSVSTNATL